MAIRSMTAYAQVTGTADEHAAFTLSLKSVNHRFLDLHFRMPPQMDALEMKLRRAMKDKLARGHVDLNLSIDGATADGVAINRSLVGGYITAFRNASTEFGLSAEPDLNAILRLPGAMNGGQEAVEDPAFEEAVLDGLTRAIDLLDKMRQEEGRGIARELRERIAHLKQAIGEVEKLRSATTRAYLDKVQSRMKELIGPHADPDRILQEAALLAERSDIQEEIVRLTTHVDHFLGMLDGQGEVGKKLDFLLQEMNREANTLLSKTSGVAGEGLRITELGLQIKSEIEKAREQVQNVE
jgi:uncharacterized protein (TIGR00255 family)